MYSNSAKFNHSIYHFLKIFYERSSKSYKTYSILGNVFKNSKWTNYKIQNIKLSFISSFTKIFLSLIFSFILFYNFKLNIICLLELFNNFFLILFRDALYDYISFAMSILLSYVYLFKHYIINFYLYLLYPTNNNDLPNGIRFFNVKSCFENKYPVSYSNLNLSNSNITLSSKHLILTHTLFKIKDNLFWINYSEVTPYNTIVNNNSKFFNLNGKFLVNLDSRFKNLPYKYFLKNLNSCYTIPFQFHENVSTSLNSNSLNRLNKTFSNTSLFENILNESINILKQSRWLSRNLTISDRFILNTNYFTEYKKLLGNSTTVSKLANNNVWASSNLNKVNFQQLFSLFSNYRNTFNNENVIDKFDESRLWLFKKIYFNTLMRYSDAILSFKLNKELIKSNNHSYNNYSNEFIKKSLPYNIIFLDNVTRFENVIYSYKNNNVNKSNFTYSVYDTNLLSDTGLDIIINLAICSNSNVEKLYFYSNIDFSLSDYPISTFSDIIYKK